MAGALAGGGDGALADGFGVAGRHAQAVAGEGLAERRPGRAQLGGGGVDAAELFGELEGAFGFGPVDQEPAGLPAKQARQGGIEGSPVRSPQRLRNLSGCPIARAEWRGTPPLRRCAPGA